MNKSHVSVRDQGSSTRFRRLSRIDAREIGRRRSGIISRRHKMRDRGDRAVQERQDTKDRVDAPPLGASPLSPRYHLPVFYPRVMLIYIRLCICKDVRSPLYTSRVSARTATGTPNARMIYRSRFRGRERESRDNSPASLQLVCVFSMREITGAREDSFARNLYASRMTEFLLKRIPDTRKWYLHLMFMRPRERWLIPDML